MISISHRCNSTASQVGVIESSFGKSGKFKVYFRDGVKGTELKAGTRLVLKMRKYCKLHAKGTAHGGSGGGVGGAGGK